VVLVGNNKEWWMLIEMNDGWYKAPSNTREVTEFSAPLKIVFRNQLSRYALKVGSLPLSLRKSRENLEIRFSKYVK
jgi:hypothetical protein